MRHRRGSFGQTRHRHRSLLPWQRGVSGKQPWSRGLPSPPVGIVAGGEDLGILVVVDFFLSVPTF